MKAVQNHFQTWKYLLNSLGLDENEKKQINGDDLFNPDSDITKSILFIYSMETFIAYNLNLAIR